MELVAHPAASVTALQAVLSMRETGKGGVQDRCVNHARRRMWYVRKTKSPSHNGLPDDFFAKQRHGRKVAFFVEFKATGEVPTALQIEEHRLMREAGLTVCVIDDVDEFKVLLATLEP